MANELNVKERKPNQFGHADGPDPSAAGSKSRPRVSLVASLKAALRADPDRLASITESLLVAAERGDATAVNAVRTLLDRLDGPVAVQLDVRADTSRLLLQGETLDMIPAMPEEVALLEQDADGSYSADPDATE